MKTQLEKLPLLILFLFTSVVQAQQAPVVIVDTAPAGTTPVTCGSPPVHKVEPSI